MSYHRADGTVIERDFAPIKASEVSEMPDALREMLTAYMNEQLLKRNATDADLEEDGGDSEPFLPEALPATPKGKAKPRVTRSPRLARKNPRRGAK